MIRLFGISCHLMIKDPLSAWSLVKGFLVIFGKGVIRKFLTLTAMTMMVSVMALVTIDTNKYYV